MRRKILCLLIAFFMAIGLFSTEKAAKAASYYEERWAECVAKVQWADTGLTPWDGTAQQPTNGSGTEADPYLITTAPELRWCLTNGQVSCKLMSDIDLGGKDNKNWLSTGIPASANTVVIDGNGHTIYNLFSEHSGAGVFGLIGYAANPNFVLKNLTLSNVYIHVTAGGADHYAATLVGKFNAGTVENCLVKNALVNGNNGTTNGVAGLFAPDNSGGSGIIIRNTRAINVHVYGAGCVSGFIEGPWGRAASILLENCSAIDGTAISTGGHSGGFTSCVEISGTATYNNCYTNIDVYGNTQTGVFVGVTHGGTHIFNNCYASGKIEGTDTIGGFFGCTSGAARETFTNCYSTSMVGMSNGGKNMGGFVGVGSASTTYAVNCYAAGEVGTLRSAPDGMPLDASGNRLTGNNVTGFSGNNIGNFTNCYYDKQTTAMCELGNISGHVTGVLTKDLIATNLGDQWVTSSGGYPELAVFANSADAYDRACSSASVSTVHLYASEDKTDYDTVRKIRYVFPLTSNENSGKIGFNVYWNNYVGEDPSNPLFPNVSPLVEGTVPIITLSNVGTKDNVSSVAPGIGWLQVNSKTDGVIGKRRLRLVPTTSIAISSSENAVMGVDRFIYTSPEKAPENYRPLLDEEIYYDHRSDISFVTTDAYKLNQFILDGTSYPTLENKLDHHKISSVPFPTSVEGKFMTGDEYVDDEGEILEYRFGADLNNDIIRIRLSFQQEDGTLKELLWTNSLLDLVTEKRTAKQTTKDSQGEEGVYVLDYEWLDSTGSLKAQSSKKLSVTRPGTITYYWNDSTHMDSEGVYVFDPGAYRYAESITQALARTPSTSADGDTASFGLPQVPERKGYTFTNWKTSVGDTGDVFDENTPVIGDMKVYAQWKADQYTMKYETEDGEVIIENQETDTPIQLPDPKPTKEDYSLVGWTPNPDGEKVLTDLDEKTLLDIMDEFPENGEITLYPVWEKNPDPEVKVKVENVTHPSTGQVQVKDVLKYTIEATNKEADTRWQDVTITNRLPEGLTLNEESIYLVGPDGEKIALDVKEVYDEATRTIQVPIEKIQGKEVYVLEYEAYVNEKALKEEHEDIHSTIEVEGKNPDGSEKEVEDQVVVPTGGEKILLADPEPEIKVSVENKTHPEGESKVGDELRYTIEVTNKEEHSTWVDVKIEELIPEGLTILPEGIEIEYPDGHKEVVKLEDVYDEKTRSLSIPVGDIEGEETYTIKIDVKINEAAKDKKTSKKEDIGINITAIGKTPTGVSNVMIESEKVYPEGWMGISTGDKTEMMSWMMAAMVSLGACLHMIRRKKEEL